LRFAAEVFVYLKVRARADAACAREFFEAHPQQQGVYYFCCVTPMASGVPRTVARMVIVAGEPLVYTTHVPAPKSRRLARRFSPKSSGTSQEGAMSSKRVVLVVLVGLISGLVLAVIGFVVGAMYGGNYATNFEFNGLRGYEAAGQIGEVIGLLTGGALGSYMAVRLTRRLGRRTTGS
jgi:hypothetical protein